MKDMRSVLVTGASGGIGAAIAKELAEKKWRVFLGYHHNRERAEALAEQLGDNTYALHVNVRDEASVDDMMAKIARIQKDEPLYALVNCAGVDQYGLFQDLSLSAWRHVMDTNVTGTFLITRAVIAGMIRAKQGVILNLSSIWGARGASCEVAYSTSKGAIDAFTKALAQEVSWCGIRVNALAPGVVRTTMFDHLSEADQKETLSEIPFGRAAEPEEIAHYASFMLSDEAAYLTGQIITMAGGFVI